MKLWREIKPMQRFRLITLLAFAGLAGFSLGGSPASGVGQCWHCQRNDDFGGKFTCEDGSSGDLYAETCKAHRTGCSYTDWAWCY